MSRGIRWTLAGVALVLASACFGSAAIQRSYYVLYGVTVSDRARRPIAGHVRVRNMDTASIYEKFQIVVRRSPYELSYSETDVWAVKPNQMVADVIAEALSNGNQFTKVARELGELRPNFILSGDMHAIEVYQSEDHWFAHLAIVMQLSRFEDGETLLTYKFDERKPVPAGTFSQAARAMSELLSTALDELIAKLDRIDVPREPPPPPPPPPLPAGTADDDQAVSGSVPLPISAGAPDEPVVTDAGEDRPARVREEAPPKTIFVPVRQPATGVEPN